MKGPPKGRYAHPFFLFLGRRLGALGEEVSALTAGLGGLCLEGTQDVSAASRPPLQGEQSGVPTETVQEEPYTEQGNKTEPPYLYSLFRNTFPLTAPSSTHAQLANDHGQLSDQNSPETGS